MQLYTNVTLFMVLQILRIKSFRISLGVEKKVYMEGNHG